MKQLLLIVGVLLVLTSCKKESEEEVFRPIESGIRGYIQKGPFLSGSTITIQELGEEFIPNGKTYITSTENDFGEFEIRSTIGTQFVEVLAQGFYFNEVSGEVSSANLTLRSIVKIQEEMNTNVNVLTTLSKDRIIHLMVNNQLGYDEARSQAEVEILRIFGIDEQISDFDKMDISKKADRDAVLIAISTVLQGDRSVGVLSELLSKINLDIRGDGVLNNLAILELLRESVKQQDVLQVKSNLENRYNQLGLDIEVPVFEVYSQRLIPLNFVSSFPEDKSIDNLRDVDVRFNFNKKVDRESVNRESFRVLNSGSIVSGNFELINNGFSVLFTPDEALLPLTTYEVELTSELKGIDGTILQDNEEFSFTTESYDINTGLISRYKLNSDFIDLGTNKKNAVGVGGLFTNDRFGLGNSSYKLDTYGDYVDLPRSFSIRNSEWTYSMWFKLEKLPSQKDDAFLLTRKNVDYDSDILLYVDDDDNAIKVAIVDGHYKMSSGVVAKVNKWYFASVVISANGIQLYVNGELTAETEKRYTDNLAGGEPLTISPKYTGSWGDTAEEYGKVLGDVDDIRIYNRCLNPRELKLVYAIEADNSAKKIAKIVRSNEVKTVKVSELNWP